MKNYGLKLIWLGFIVLILIMNVGCMNGSSYYAQAFTPTQIKKRVPDEGVKIHFIQLTNGEATLIHLENGKNILIDTGSRSSKEEIIEYLRNQKVRSLDSLILTNNRDEHIGSYQELMEHFRIERVYIPFHLEKEIKEEFGTEGISYIPLKAGEKLSFGENSKLVVLHPNSSLSLSPQDNSLVFQFIHEKNIFLFTSDISEQVESALVDQYNLHSQILKVSDFGSNQSSCAEFLDEVDAHIAVIFHRPDFYLDSEVLERLEESWTEVYALKKHGHLVIVSNKNDYETFIIPVKKDNQEE